MKIMDIMIFLKLFMIKEICFKKFVKMIQRVFNLTIHILMILTWNREVESIIKKNNIKNYNYYFIKNKHNDFVNEKIYLYYIFIQ